MVKILFKDIRTCVVNAGSSSGFFYPSLGIRQGCCCLPSLFVIAVEFLAILVRQSTSIKGITVADRQIKISQYADDATFFLRDYASLDSILQMIQAFTSISGLHVNHQKSYLLLLGHHLDPPSQYEGISIQDQVTILGITFKYEMTEAQHYALNFQPKLNKIKAICSTWMNRTLSLKGSLMSSILQYPCSNTATPTRVLVEFKKIITDFFWNDKRGKVAYNVLIQDIPGGGIKLPDLMTRLKTSHLYWIRYLWDNPDSIMAAQIKDALNSNDIHYLLTCKTELAHKLHPSNSFLRDILSTWVSLHIKEPREEADIQKEMIWDNNFILIKQKPFAWRNAGIIRINDLLHEHRQHFLSHTELQQKYGVNITFLELLQLRSAIPCSWKRKLTSVAQQELVDRPAFYTEEGKPVSVTGKSLKSIYYLLVKFIKLAITAQLRWNDIFPVHKTDPQAHWSNIYKPPYKAACDTKLQAFQFRVLHRLVPCNKFLRNIGIKREDTCSYCQEIDTIKHFLFACPIVKTFWEGVVAWFNREADVQLDLPIQAFLFGVPETAHQARIINFVLLFSKFFIYRQKLFHQGHLDLIPFLHELRTRLQVEKYLTTLENKKHLFHKWQ